MSVFEKNMLTRFRENHPYYVWTCTCLKSTDGHKKPKATYNYLRLSLPLFLQLIACFSFIDCVK